MKKEEPKIEKLTICVGGRELVITSVGARNPGMRDLMAMSDSVVIKVPQSAEAKAVSAALYVLIFDEGSGAKLEGVEEGIATPDLEALIPALSMPVTGLLLATEINEKLLEEAGVQYVWEIAEASRESWWLTLSEAYRAHIEVALAGFGLSFGMDLSSVKDRLPKPPVGA